ncbi:MAG: DEAD/DEAH box helicase [Fimbriimonadaceae bacterium]|nr:DEAD/DEAH box helicase [Fimbriimonadaceae bacterium]
MKPHPLNILHQFAEEFSLDLNQFTMPAMPGRFAELQGKLHPRLSERLAELGFDKLYSHQAEAIDHALMGINTVLATGTSSGKTLAFLAPILNACYSEPNARALILYPTKALSQDQLASFQNVIGTEPVRLSTYDGDTPKSQRSTIRKSAHIVISNPDMLHLGILPSHELWTPFLRNLRYIVLDEMHTYTGVFGSHVGGIIRRLLRLCAWHNAKPTIIAATATTANPQEHFRLLTSREAMIVLEDGAPKPERTYAFAWRRLDASTRPASQNQLTGSLLANLTQSGCRSLAFNQSRTASELVQKYAATQLELSGEGQGNKIDSYRGGYTPKERREIEKRFRSGDLLGIASTNALELGIDIGGLDVVLMNGYPGSIASYWQQAGRSGRGKRPGLAVMLAADNPLDFLIVSDPERFLRTNFGGSPLNPGNPAILSQQIKCAAYERALGPEEIDAFGMTAGQVVADLEAGGELTFSAGRYFYPEFDAPAPKVNIRSAGGDVFKIVTKDGELGTMEYWRVLQSGFPGAVYLHRGQTYVVNELDLISKEVKVETQDVAHYTTALLRGSSNELIEIDRRAQGLFEVGLCSVQIHEHVDEYQRRSLDGSKTSDTEPLDLPSIDYQTLAVRFEAKFPAEDEVASLHGFEHALLATAPLIAGCSPQDIGSVWFVELPEHEGSVLYIYDRAPGGIGLTEILYESVTEWIESAKDLLLSCSCTGGCPRCLLLPRCPDGNDVLSKLGALEWLERALDSR